jgi:hypothetical protein
LGKIWAELRIFVARERERERELSSIGRWTAPGTLSVKVNPGIQWTGGLRNFIHTYLERERERERAAEQECGSGPE